MNRTSLPISPFTTALSGSARETELRIRSIFQGKRRRPPLPLLILLLAAVFVTGCTFTGAQAADERTAL